MNQANSTRRRAGVRHTIAFTLVALINCISPVGGLAFAGDMPLIDETLLLDPDSGASGQFGTAVAIDNNVAVVGVPSAIVGGARPGKAVVLERVAGDWVAMDTLVASDGLDGDEFGVSAAISGDTIVVAAPGATVNFNSSQGAVHLFLFQGSGLWSWSGKLLAADAEQSDNLGGFGNGVEIVGDIVIAGAPNHNQIGAAYVFRRRFLSDVQTQWIHESKLTPPDGQSSDSFGFSVSHTGGSALIGAPFADDGDVLDRGAGYFFTRSPAGVWSLRQKFVCPRKLSCAAASSSPASSASNADR